MSRFEQVSGHVFRREGARGPVWYAKYRLADGQQIQKRIGPAWTERGRPADGCFTKRTANDWLREQLDRARAGLVVRTGVRFDEAAEEWLRYAVEDRACKPSTMQDYRHTVRRVLIPFFGALPVEAITPQAIEVWRTGLKTSARTRNKQLTILNGIFRRACRLYGVPTNPVSGVERLREPRTVHLEVLEPEEVWALVRAAVDEQDAALFLTGAFTGLRMGELRALCWRDVDFARSTVRVRASYSAGALTSPKSGKVRAVPMAPDVATALARLARRERWTGDEDLVFPGELGSYFDDSAVRRRYKAALVRAGLRELRFHDLRHTFGTRMIAEADILRVKEWMGHADVHTTMRYLHFAPRAEDAKLVAKAFALPAAQLSEPGVDIGTDEAHVPADGDRGQRVDGAAGVLVDRGARDVQQQPDVGGGEERLVA
jgi:integrase